MKAVFVHKMGSVYDDLPEERYHFPRIYLRQVEAAVGDHIIYYEPGRTGPSDHDRRGLRAYVAVAQIVDVILVSAREDYFYARIDPLSYLPFDRAVPFREGGHFHESALRRADGGTNKGAFGRAVRHLPDEEFESILTAGFAAELGTAAAPEPGVPFEFPPGLLEAPATFARPVIERIMTRPVRDATFARAVAAAYSSTCALTGLRIVNGGGHAEIEAAHIRPVQHAGPDSVRNGLALSRTAHWLFDRGLVSIGTNHEILVASDSLPEPALRLLHPSGRLLTPADPRLHPAPAYLEFHRRQVFKGGPLAEGRI